MPTTIKIAAVSDLHGELDGFAGEVHSIKPDVLVIAGDMHPCRIDVSADRWFEKQFFPLMAELKIPVIAVPGNHDFWLNEYLCRSNDPSLLPPNFHLLCDGGMGVCGLTFYGTPWVPWISGRWCFEASDNSLAYQFSKIPYGVDVLIAHSPPNIKHELIDISTENDERCWRHFGSKELTREIRIKKPRIVFCGHIHSGQHGPTILKDALGNKVCPCYNVSRLSERYSVTYGLTEVNIPVVTEETAHGDF